MNTKQMFGLIGSMIIFIVFGLLFQAEAEQHSAEGKILDETFQIMGVHIQEKMQGIRTKFVSVYTTTDDVDEIIEFSNKHALSGQNITEIYFYSNNNFTPTLPGLSNTESAFWILSSDKYKQYYIGYYKKGVFGYAVFYPRNYEELQKWKLPPIQSSNKSPTNMGYSQVDFYTIRKNMNQMTDVQFKRYTKSLVGKKVTWVGWVEEVKKKMFGGYECLIDMDPPDALSVQDVTFEVSESVALKLIKNKKVSFTGRIKSVFDIFGSTQINLDSVSVKF